MGAGMNRWLLCLIYGLVLSVCELAHGDEAPWDGKLFSSDPASVIAAANATPSPQDSDVEILLLRSTYQFDEQGRRRFIFRKVYRCLTKEGVDNWSYVEATWSPWCEDKPILRARVITSDGKEHVLDPKIIGEAPVSQDEKILSDRRLVRAPLPALAVGAIVELETEVSETKPFFARGSVGHFYLAMFNPARKIQLVVESPLTLPLQYIVRGEKLEPRSSQQEGRKRLAFQKTDVKQLKWYETNLPPESPPWPEVIFSTGESWNKVASGYSDITEKQLDAASVESLARETVGEETNREKKATKLLETVHRLVRYTGVEFGEAAIEPRTPLETLTRRYGDCKDQAALLVAMLRAVNIPANLALLKIGEQTDVVPDMPGMNNFDHAIVYMPGSPAYWIDPTSEYTPFGKLPIWDQGRFALVVDPRTQKLERTPRDDYKANCIEETREYVIYKGDRGNVKERYRATGSMADDYRRSYATRNEVDIKKSWKERAEGVYKSRNVVAVKTEAIKDLDQPFQCEVEIADAQISLSKETPLIAVYPYRIFMHLPAQFREVKLQEDTIKGEKDADIPDKRQSPLMLPEPHVYKIEYIITPPPDFVPEALPEDMVKQCGPATITQNFAWKDGKVHAVFRFDSGEGKFSPDEVENLREAIAALGVDGDGSKWEERIVLSHGVNKIIAAGKLDQAFRDCKHELQEHPDSEDSYIRYSQVLLKAGFGEAARKNGKKAVELSPKSVAAQINLADIYCCDLIGRRFHPGMYWFGANEAYQSALELDPTNVDTRWNYAILLEHDQLGRHFSPSADVNGAIQEYRKITKGGVYEKVAESLTLAHACALMHLERFSEAKQLLTESNTTVFMNAIDVAISAIEQGPVAARQKAERLEPDNQKRNILLNTAADYLNEMRYYPLSKSLMEMLPEDMQKEQRFRMQLIGGTRRIDKPTVPETSPFWPIEQLYVGILTDGKDDSRLADLFVSGSNKQDVADAIASTWRSMIPSINILSDKKLTPRRIADMTSIFYMKPNGKPEVGYQVAVSGGMLDKKVYWYVLFQNGKFSIFPPGHHTANLGAAAMQCLTIKELKKAEKWLDWAYDEHKQNVGWVDPFSGSPFGRIWWENAHDNADLLMISAAALTCEGSQAGRVVPILAEEQKKTHSEKLSLQIDRAIALGYLNSGNLQGLLETSNKILAMHEESSEAMNWKSITLWGMGRSEELRNWLRLRLDAKNIPASARETLSLQASKVGDFDLAFRNLRLLAEQKTATPQGLNELAWIAIIYDTADETSLVHAAYAQKIAKDNPAAYLNTVAAVYAAIGKPKEALDTLYQCVDARGGEPQDPDWCVLGRTAESYGLNDIAKSLYGKVSRPRRQTANDSYTFAQRTFGVPGA